MPSPQQARAQASAITSGKTAPEAEASPTSQLRVLFDDGPHLSPGQRRIAQYLIENITEAAFLSITDLAERVGVSQPSVTRCSSSSSSDSTTSTAKADATATTVAAGTKVDANTASKAEIAAALEAAGVPNAERWADEVTEYRPYPTDDPTFGKLRDELAKYRPADGVIDQIISVLSL